MSRRHVVSFVLFVLILEYPTRGDEVGGGRASEEAVAAPAASEESPPVLDTEAPTSAPVESTEESAAKDESAAPAKAAPPKNWYVASKAIGVRLETQPPGYVKTFDKFGFPGTEELSWLELGLENRTRYELRRDEYRPSALRVLRNNQILSGPSNLDDDEYFLMRSRAYLGIRDILDPLRFGFEFQDARQFGSSFADTDRDSDENDFAQAFMELYFKDALGPGRPARFQAGRMTFDYVDRRLVGRSRWRNTPNAFDGFRMQLGEQASDWQVDVFAAQPVVRWVRKLDRPDEEQWLYGVVGAWRRWSEYITIEPYYFFFDQDQGGRPLRLDREIHTIGLRGYGPIKGTNFDYDADAMFQLGDDGLLNDRAFATTAELGYTFQAPWKPRLAVLCNYATGDNNPDDHVNNRFDRLYAPGHPLSENDMFDLRNTISPGLRLQFAPLETVKFETMYRAHWLASDTDAWPIPGRRDPSGGSGDFVGQALSITARWEITKQIELEMGYAHFLPGPFARNTGPADDSDFFYVQTTIKLDR